MKRILLSVLVAVIGFCSPAAVNVARSVTSEMFPGREVATAIAVGLAQSALIGLLAAALLVIAPLAV